MKNGIVRVLLVVSVAAILPAAAAPSAAPPRLNQAGPDAYGYRFIDNINESLGPIHSAVYQDISTSSTATALPILSEDGWTVITIPILLRMYGQNWGTPPQNSGITVVTDDAEISANGFVALLGPNQSNPGAGMYANQSLPSADARIVPGGFIAALWDDWAARGTNDAAHWDVIGTAPNRRFVVQWTNWSFGNVSEDMTFQVQITESNGQVDSDIYLSYLNVNSGSEYGTSATIGIQGGATPATSLTYSLNNSPLSNPTAGDSSTNPETPRTIVFYTGANPPRLGAGSGPGEPANVKQIGSFGDTSQGGWTATSVAFQADVTDGDLDEGVPQQVALEARYRKVGNGAWTTVTSGNSPQGTISVSVDLAASNPAGNFGDGVYDWEYRVRDANFSYWPADPNGIPQWQPFLGNAVSPDFRSDQEPASPPLALTPAGTDVSSPYETADLVSFSWGESTDNGPLSSLRYEIQVARNVNFTDLESAASGIIPTNAALSVTVSRFAKFWRVRTTDIGGNVSQWSNVQQFRLVWDDGQNHSAGDAQKACGFGAGSTSAPRAGLLFGLVTLAMMAAVGLGRKKG